VSFVVSFFRLELATRLMATNALFTWKMSRFPSGLATSYIEDVEISFVGLRVLRGFILQAGICNKANGDQRPFTWKMSRFPSWVFVSFVVSFFRLESATRLNDQH